MSEAIIAKKAELVDVVAEKMKAAASIVVVDARGLTVDQDTVLRRELRGSEVEYKVIKNSILRRAAEKAGLEELASVFVGPSAVAFSNEDVIAPAIFLKLLTHLKSRVVQSKALSHQKKRSLLLQLFQTAKDFFLCSFLYFKRQCATLLLQSKRLQTTKKTQLNPKLRSVA